MNWRTLQDSENVSRVTNKISIGVEPDKIFIIEVFHRVFQFAVDFPFATGALYGRM